MTIGEMTHRVTLQQLSSGQDSVGQLVQTWTTVASRISADVRYPKGVQLLRNNAEVSIVQASVRIRYRPAAAGMRVLHDSAVLDVRAVLPDERKRFIDLVCEVVHAAA